MIGVADGMTLISNRFRGEIKRTGRMRAEANTYRTWVKDVSISRRPMPLKILTLSLVITVSTMLKNNDTEKGVFGY